MVSEAKAGTIEENIINITTKMAPTNFFTENDLHFKSETIVKVSLPISYHIEDHVSTIDYKQYTKAFHEYLSGLGQP